MHFMVLLHRCQVHGFPVKLGSFLKISAVGRKMPAGFGTNAFQEACTIYKFNVHLSPN